MDAPVQKMCAWCGVVMVVLWVVGFAMAGFIPLPSPNAGAGQIAAMYRHNTNGIRFGALLTATGSAFLGPFIAVISVHMRRMEGRSTPLAYTQLALGAILVLEFVYPTYLWQWAAFRADRPAETLQAMNDVAWLLFVGVVSTAVLEMLVVGVAILRDTGEQPIVPRWMGYLSLWTGLLFCPGSILVFFKTGPFAWNGLFAIYLPATIFIIWIGCMIACLLKAINREAAEHLVAESVGSPGSSAVSLDVERRFELMSAQIDSLRAELRTSRSATDGSG